MRKHAHAWVVAACLGCFAAAGAQAATPAAFGVSDLVFDKAIGLAGVEALASRAGPDPAYRLNDAHGAHGDGAAGLVDTATRLSEGLFALGADPKRPDGLHSFVHAMSMGYLADADGAKNRLFGGERILPGDAIGATGVAARGSGFGLRMAGILSGDGVIGAACLAHGCATGAPWGATRDALAGPEPDFFVDNAVRMPASEPVNAQIWALSLFTLGGLAVRRRS